jgi:hypothetical protein
MDSLPEEFEHTLRANNRIALSSFDQFFDFARVTKCREAPRPRTLNYRSHPVNNSYVNI